MKLDLLLSRESFPQVFTDTLSKYLIQRFGWQGEISWKKRRELRKDILLVHGKLNLIFPACIESELLKPLIAEYAYNPHSFRYFLQNLYVKNVINKPFRHLVSTASIHIDPWVEQMSNWSILPGNHSIRVIELDCNKCRVLLKEGFNKKFIFNEIQLRKNNPGLPIPKLLEWDDDGKWYTEERVIALPWNRLSDNLVKEYALSGAQKALVDLYDLDCKAVKVSVWLFSLIQALGLAIERLPSLYTADDKDRLKNIVNWFNNIAHTGGDERVDIVQTHGDFQPANILIETNNRNKFYIIDWEYSEKRPIFYDALVFASECRSPKGMANRIHQLSLQNNIYWQWCFADSNQKQNLTHWLLSLFLLEDLLVRLHGLDVPDLIKQDTGLDTWLQEVEGMNWLVYE